MPTTNLNLDALGGGVAGVRARQLETATRLLRSILATINTTDGDHPSFVDSGSDSIDMLWEDHADIVALLAAIDAK